MLGGLRARLDEEPILVVPAFDDVEHASASWPSAAPCSARAWCASTGCSARSPGAPGYSARVGVRPPARADRGGGGAPRRLARARRVGRAPGFARAAARFVAELERSMVEPARFTRALRDWAGDGPRARVRRGGRRDLPRLPRRARRGRAGRRGAVRLARARRAARASRRAGAPRRCSSTASTTSPARARRARVARRPLRGRRDRLAALRARPRRRSRPSPSALPGAARRRRRASAPCRALDDHYAPGSRDAAPPPRAPPVRGRRRRAGRARRGGRPCTRPAASAPRSSWSAPRCSSCCAPGTEPGDVAVVLRATRPLRLAGRAGLRRLRHPVLDRPPRAARPHRLGPRAARAAALRREPADGRRRRPARLAAHPGPAEQARPGRPARGRGAAAPAPTRPRRRARSGRRERWPLDELDRLGAVATRPARFLAELERQLGRLFAAPYGAGAPVLAGAELDDPRAFEAAHEALGRAARGGGGRPAHARSTPERVHDALAELRGPRWASSPQPDRVQVAAPEAIRARRFEAVFVCGLQEGEFPRGAAPEPFLPDDDRRELAAASGLLLPLREDQLDRERYLFYVCARAPSGCSCCRRARATRRATRSRVVLRRGRARPVCARRRPSARALALRRHLAPDEAPTAAELERALAPSPARAASEPLPAAARAPRRCWSGWQAREAVSAGALERFADCPVKWLVEQLLRPDALEPDPEPMVRGSYAHAVLSAPSSACARRPGRAASRRTTCAAAERILLEALREQSGEFRLSPKQTRVRAAVRTARVRPAALPAPRGRARQRLRARAPRAARSATATAGEPVELDRA